MIAVLRTFCALPMMFILVACAPLTSTPDGDSGNSPLVVLGGTNSLEGSWIETTTWPAGGGGTYTATLIWTLNNGSFSASQVNHYSDGRSDETFSQTGTAVLQASDATVKIHETSEIYNGTGPNAIDKTRILRNVLVDGVWHPSTYTRVGTGQGIGGVWESPKSDTSKHRYSFDTGSNTITIEEFAVDAADAVTGTALNTMSTSYAWDGSELSFPPSPSTQPCKLLSDQLLETPIGSSTRVPIFHKQ